MHRTVRQRLAYAAVLGLAAAASALPPSLEVARLNSLIQNGGFEEGGEAPAFWDRHPAVDNGRNAHGRDLATRHGGQAAGRLAFLDPIAGPNQSPVQWMKYGLPAEGGSALLFAGWVRTDGVSTGRVGMHLYDAKGGHLGFRPISHPTGVAQDWQPFEQTLILPPETAKVGIALYAEKGGTTWYDDVVLLGTPTLRALRGTPVIDGGLDDAAWTAAPPVRDFVLHTGQGLAKEPTRAWVTFDDEALYVAFDCPHPAGATLKLDATQRDGTTWLDDSIEIFLDPPHDHQTDLQFCVNALGVVRDSRGQDAGWNAAVRSAARRRADGWSVEVAIPFAGLDLPLRTGTTWGLNLVRNDRVNAQTVTWSLGGFHQPSRNGNLHLDPDLRALLRPAVQRELAHLEARRQALADEFARAGLTADTATDAFAWLRRSATEAAALQAAVDAAAPLPWSACRERLAALGALITDARAAAVRALYADAADAPFAVRLADSLQKVRRDGDVTDAALTREIRLDAARDESESFQLVLIPGKAPCTVRVESAAVSGPGGRLPLAWHVVEYIETAPPKGYPAAYVGWWPDILLPAAPVALRPGLRQPLWFRVDVPPNAVPGEYRGQVALSDGANHRLAVPVTLRVRAFRLPRPGTLPCAFGLYAWALSSYYHGKTPYAEAMPPEVYRRWVEFMAEYRLTPKNVATEYLGKRTVDGQQRPDLSAVQRLIGDLAPQELPPYSFELFRLPCPPDWQHGTPKTDPDTVLQQLSDRVAEYARLGLPAQAYLYGIDEPAPEGYEFLRAIYGKARQAAPGVPIMQTVNNRIPTELAGSVDIWCPLSARLSEGMEFYRQRLTAGDTLWLYVCCAPKPPYANFFVDEPAIDHRILFWQARQAGATGVLYWCVCWWDGLPGPGNGQPAFPQVPIRFADHLATYKSFGDNGDGLLVWPGPDMTPYPSIRLEVVRDGIEDYEYLALLERCVRAAAALPAERRPPALASARALCGVPAEISRTFIDFTKDGAVLLARRTAVADAIEELLPAIGSQPPPEACVRPR